MIHLKENIEVNIKVRYTDKDDGACGGTRVCEEKEYLILKAVDIWQDEDGEYCIDEDMLDREVGDLVKKCYPYCSYTYTYDWNITKSL